MVDLSDKRIGVCLASGYFGFFAHAGFVTVLHEMGVRPVAVTGASAGALTGSLWAAGMDPPAIRDVLLSIGMTDLVDLPMPWDAAGRPGGMIRGRRMERKLGRILSDATFEDCRFDFAATAFDLDERRLHVFDSGPLAPAVRASCALPGMFAPAPVDGHVYWDGGTVEKVPLGPLARRDDIDLILINYLTQAYPPGPPPSIAAGLRAALHSLIFPEQQRVVNGLRERGIEVLVLVPDVPESGPGKLSRGPEIIDAAAAETRRILETGTFGCDQLR
jgi:NTE family protein